MKEQKNVIIGIYKITNPQNKIYVGQSVNVKKRIKKYKTIKIYNQQPKLFNSIQKYGYENHKFEIIEECDINMLDEREIYWGECFNVLGSKGLNCRLGNGKGRLSEETKQKISKANKGRKYTEEQKVKISLNKMGNNAYPKGLKRPKEFGENLSKLYREGLAKIISEKTKGKPKPQGFNAHLSKSILQYDLEGNFIKEWDSINNAARYLNKDVTNISKALVGKYKTAYNFIWKYKN